MNPGGKDTTERFARDVKPGNVLISGRRVTKVWTFGLKSDPAHQVTDIALDDGHTLSVEATTRVRIRP